MNECKLWEYSQNNSGGEYHIDESKGLVESVYIWAHTSDGANEYAKSIGIYFDGAGDCRCCGNRWHYPYESVGSDGIDLRYVWQDRVAIHKLDGSFVIWSSKHYTAPNEPKPTLASLPSLETMREAAYKVGAPKPVSEAEYKAEEERIVEANKPRYNAIESEAEPVESKPLKVSRLQSSYDNGTEAIYFTATNGENYKLSVPMWHAWTNAVGVAIDNEAFDHFLIGSYILLAIEECFHDNTEITRENVLQKAISIIHSA